MFPFDVAVSRPPILRAPARSCGCPRDRRSRRCVAGPGI